MNRTIIIKMMVDAFIIDSMSFGQTKAILRDQAPHLLISVFFWFKTSPGAVKQVADPPAKTPWRRWECWTSTDRSPGYRTVGLRCWP